MKQPSQGALGTPRGLFSFYLVPFLGSTQCANILGDWRKEHSRVRTTWLSSATAILPRLAVVCHPSWLWIHWSHGTRCWSYNTINCFLLLLVSKKLTCQLAICSFFCSQMVGNSSSSRKKNSHLTQLSVTLAQYCSHNDHVPAPSGQMQPHDIWNDLAQHLPHSLSAS